MQPTNEELNSALNLVKSLGVTYTEDTFSAMVVLHRLRNARTTWFGVEENKLRFDIDKILWSKL